MTGFEPVTFRLEV